MSSRVALVVLLAWSWSVLSAEEEVPLVVAELVADRAIAEADVATTQASQDLAKWKLGQLALLRSRGHASWQEVAEQQVALKKHVAHAQAAKQFLAAVSQWQVRLADSDLPPNDVESIGLFLPGSVRLVAWIPAEQAGDELVSRQLKQLATEQQLRANVDLASVASAVDDAKRAVDVCSRAATIHHLHRAVLKHRSAKAEYDLALAHANKATIVSRRIAQLRKLPVRTEASSSFARIGTTFVDSRTHTELNRLVRRMAVEDATSEYVVWLKQQRQKLLTRIEKLNKLSHYRAANPHELAHAQAQKGTLDELIEHSSGLQRMHQRIATDYETLEPVSKLERQEIASGVAGRRPDYQRTVAAASMPNVSLVRHMLQHRKLCLQTEADCAAIQARRDYLKERFTRLEGIDPPARQPNELENLREKIQSTEQLIGIVERQVAQLGNEEERFLCQWNSQFGNDYQLVQASEGNFFDRQDIDVGKALIAAVGFVGVPPKSCRTHAYIESAATLDYLSILNGKQQLSDIRIALFGSGKLNYPSLRFRARPGIRDAPSGYSELRLASDDMSLTSSRPHGLLQLKSDCLASPRDYLRSVSAFQSRLPNYSSEYAFGIRRLDSRSSSIHRRRANAYGGPWFLPGSPTNFRD